MSSASPAPQQPTPALPMRSLTTEETRQVTGGPMNLPALGNKPSELRDLTAAEIRQVWGG